MKYYKVKLWVIDGSQDLKYHKNTLKNLIMYGKDLPLQDIIVYKQGLKFKEIITDIEIPNFKFSEGRNKISKMSPIYFRYANPGCNRRNDEKDKTLNELQVFSDEVEKYFKEHLDISNYEINSNANYIDPKLQYQRKIMGYFEQGENELRKFADKNFIKTKSRKSKEKDEEEKIKKLVKDYLKK